MENITIKLSKIAEKQLRKLPTKTINKFHKQVLLLIEDPHDPSLRVKKIRGTDKFEARIDYQYRFSFIKYEKILYIFTIGPHDEGLGKK